MQQMDRSMVRGAKAALEAGIKDIECVLHTSRGDRDCFIVSGDFGLLTVQHGNKTAQVNPDYVEVEDEVALMLWSYYERVMENRTAKAFGRGAQSRLGTYSQGVIWNGGRR